MATKVYCPNITLTISSILHKPPFIYPVTKFLTTPAYSPLIYLLPLYTTEAEWLPDAETLHRNLMQQTPGRADRRPYFFSSREFRRQICSFTWRYIDSGSRCRNVHDAEEPNSHERRELGWRKYFV